MKIEAIKDIIGEEQYKAFAADVEGKSDTDIMRYEVEYVEAAWYEPIFELRRKTHTLEWYLRNTLEHWKQEGKEDTEEYKKLEEFWKFALIGQLGVERGFLDVIVEKTLDISKNIRGEWITPDNKEESLNSHHDEG